MSWYQFVYTKTHKKRFSRIVRTHIVFYTADRIEDAKKQFVREHPDTRVESISLWKKSYRKHANDINQKVLEKLQKNI